MKQSNVPAMRRLPTREEIAERAHQIHLECGAEPGHEIDDWLQAEYELMQLPVSEIAGISPAQVDKGRMRKSALVNLVQWAFILGTIGITQFRK
jgi:hypothetical protein